MKGVLRKFQGHFKEVTWKIEVSSVFHDFQGCFQSVSSKFQENFQDVSKKFHAAWHSSQLPEKKEGLFVIQKATSTKNEVEFYQRSIDAIKCSLASSCDVKLATTSILLGATYTTKHTNKATYWCCFAAQK